jgi:ribosomal protein S18 acetylase RimI-like enzyme
MLGRSFTGKNVELRPTQKKDVDEIIQFEIINKKFVHSYSKEKHIELLDDPDCMHLCVYRRDSSELIGHVILFGLQDIKKIVEFRRITIMQQGLGFGREVVSLIQQICFEKLVFESIWLDVYDDNSTAIKLYESQGFKFSRMIYDPNNLPHDKRNQRIYKMSKSEYFNMKDSVEYYEKIPDEDAYWNLFKETGWNDYYSFTSSDLYEAISNSWYAISAFIGDNLIGFGRIISDGIHHAFIVDMIVSQAYQGKGIGKEILTRLINKCKKNNIRDIQLFAAEGKSGFYEKNGFAKRPSKAPGMQL